jgi:thiol:disulfide interchange protein DsbD
MKKLFFAIVCVYSLLSSSMYGDGFLQPKDAFRASVKTTQNHIEFDLHLDKTIYVYDEFLKVTILPQNIDITKKLNIKKPIHYHEFDVHFDNVNIKVPISLINKYTQNEPFSVKFEYQGCSKAGLCYSPMSISYKSSQQIKNKTKQQTKQLINKTQTSSITQTLQQGNIVLILVTFFGFGLLLALTPCIFPMIPILSSIIVQHSNSNGAKMSASKGCFLSLVYVLSMSIAYTIAGILAGLFGANIQAVLQNPYIIVLFSAIFVALAFSMFGYFEIALPSSWQTKLNQTSNNSSKSGSIIGIAIMGFLSALIVGPCVAPPLAGALVYIGQTGDAVLGGLALFVMSLGMGVPLLAIGIGAGKYMPKPGGWMIVVSKVFGVVMLGVAIWMLDRIVPAIVTVVLFVILMMGSAYYLIKKGNNYGKIVASLLMIGSIVFVKISIDSINDTKLPFKYITSVQELNMIVAHSKKPIMIDFWASWCVSCKEFDNITFKNKEIRNILSNYLLLKVDVTKNRQEDKELMKKFNLFGPPAIIFYKNGKQLENKTIIGVKSPKEFLNILNEKDN